MRKFFPYILILAILVGLGSPISTLRAQTPNGGLCYFINAGVPSVAPNTTTLAQCNQLSTQHQWLTDAQIAAGVQPNIGGNTTTSTGIPGTGKEVTECGLFGSWTQCFTDLIAAVFVAILKAISFLLWLSGQLLNYILQFTIVDMKTNLAGLTGINIAWKVVRDLMNIVFIFLLIYEGIKLIIGLGSRAGIQKFIGMIVLASLLVNFSLFFTKVLIDASNIVTIGFYNQILGTNAQNAGFLGRPYGLSDPIVKALRLSSVYGQDNPTLGAQDGLGGILIAGFGSALIILIGSFVFFAVAIMFVIRYLTLILLLMLSPVAFMGMALPSMQGHAKDWWASLNGQLLFAPVYMIMTWIILTLMTSPGFFTPGATFAQAFDNTSTVNVVGKMNLLVNFALIIGLLIASLVISKSTASKGSKYIGQMTGKATAFAGGAIVGSAAKIGRNTMGRAGNALSQNESLKDTAANGNVVTRNLAKFTLNRSDRAAKSTFDARGTGAFGALSEATGVKFGKAPDKKKVNFQKDLEAKAKKEEEFAKSLKPNEDVFDEAKKKDKVEKERLEGVKNDAEKIKKEAEDKHKKADEEIGILNKKITDKQKEFDESKIPEYKKVLEEDLNKLKKEAEDKKKNLEDLKKIADESRKAHTQASAEHKEYKSQVEDTVKKIYEERVGAYADIIENESRAYRYSANLGRMMLGKFGLGNGLGDVHTARDNKVVARKVRGVLKEKSNKEKAAEFAAKAASDERKEKKAAGEEVEGDEEEKPKEEKPETPPET